MTQNHTEKICAEEYTVKRGDSFYLIAHKLGVPLRDLLAANRDIHPARLMVGDVLCIPREEDDTPSAGTGTGNAGSSGSSTGSTGGTSGSGNTGSTSGTTDSDSTGSAGGTTGSTGSTGSTGGTTNSGSTDSTDGAETETPAGAGGAGADGSGYSVEEPVEPPYAGKRQPRRESGSAAHRADSVRAHRERALRRAGDLHHGHGRNAGKSGGEVRPAGSPAAALQSLSGPAGF